MIPYTLGVDPGASGAFALLSRFGVVDILDMPVHHIKKKRRLDLYALARFFDLHGTDIAEAVIENVHSMPKQGVASSFAFGFAAGAAQAMVASALIPMRLVTPQAWKSKVGLRSADKDAARLLASQLYPRDAHRWARVKDDGRAEAVLLAHYGIITKEQA